MKPGEKLMLSLIHSLTHFLLLLLHMWCTFPAEYVWVCITKVKVPLSAVGGLNVEKALYRGETAFRAPPVVMAKDPSSGRMQLSTNNSQRHAAKFASAFNNLCTWEFFFLFTIKVIVFGTYLLLPTCLFQVICGVWRRPWPRTKWRWRPPRRRSRCWPFATSRPPAFYRRWKKNVHDFTQNVNTKLTQPRSSFESEILSSVNWVGHKLSKWT